MTFEPYYTKEAREAREAEERAKEEEIFFINLIGYLCIGFMLVACFPIGLVLLVLLMAGQKE